MTRNTTRRLEIAAPVLDPRIKAELERMFGCYWKDNVKARELVRNGSDSNGFSYEKISGTFAEYCDAQEELFMK